MSSLKKAVLGVLGTRMTVAAQVQSVSTVSGLYRLIDIVSEGFVGATCEPTAKVQLDVGEWDLRTYTPIEIDAVQGQARLLFFLHGEGPASGWANAARPGTTTRIAGPKPSLTLTDLQGATVFFGDETSLAAAATLQRHGAGKWPILCVFEVADADQARIAAEGLGLHDATFVAKDDGADHVDRLVALLLARKDAHAATDLVLTGNGRSIQAVRAALKARGRAAVRQRVKAYWTPGKVGLD